MLYLFAIIFPPIAFFGAGKPGQGILSIVLMLTIIGRIPAMIWAILVVNSRNADRRQKAMIAAQEAAVRQQTATLLAGQSLAAEQQATALAAQLTTPTVEEQNQFSA